MTDWKTFEKATQDLDPSFADQQSESSRDIGALQQEYSQTSHLQGGTGHGKPVSKPAHAVIHPPESHAGVQHSASTSKGGSAGSPTNATSAVASTNGNAAHVAK